MNSSTSGSVVAVVLARWGASRLPGKMGMPIGDAASSVHLTIERLKAAKKVDHIVLATSTASDDDRIARVADELGVRLFRGSEDDVVGRMASAVASVPGQARIVARVNCDNPLHFPHVLDAGVDLLDRTGGDLAHPFEANTLPFGAGPVQFTLDALTRIDSGSTAASYREHVETFCMERPGEFAIRYQRASPEETWHELLLTLDYDVDLSRLRRFASLLEGVPIREQLRYLVAWGQAVGASLRWQDGVVVDAAFEDLRAEVFETATGPRWGLRYESEAVAGASPVYLDDCLADGLSAIDFWRRHEARLRRTIPGGPLRPVAAQEGGFPPPEKQVSVGGRRGFAHPLAVGLPQLIHLAPAMTVDTLAAVVDYVRDFPVAKVLATDAVAVSALQEVAGDRLVAGPPADDLWYSMAHRAVFSGVHIAADGELSAPGASHRGRFPEVPLAEWWSAPEMWHARAAVLDEGGG